MVKLSPLEISRMPFWLQVQDLGREETNPKQYCCPTSLYPTSINTLLVFSLVRWWGRKCHLSLTGKMALLLLLVPDVFLLQVAGHEEIAAQT